MTLLQVFFASKPALKTFFVSMFPLSRKVATSVQERPGAHQNLNAGR